MVEGRFFVPTYYGAQNEIRKAVERRAEFGEPVVPISAVSAGGVRLVLGSSDARARNVPDILVERRPNGWAVHVQPVGSGDSSGFVYLLDDGRSYAVPECGGGPTPPLEWVGSVDSIPELDQIGALQPRFTPQRSRAT